VTSPAALPALPADAAPPGSARAGPTFWRRFRRNSMAVASLAFVGALVTLVLLGPAITPYDYKSQDVMQRLRPPSAAHWMGTDDFGRDILSRVVVGGRASLAVGVASVLVLAVTGTLVGTFAGFYRRLDGPLMRFVDVLMSVPSFFLLLMVVALFGANLQNTILVIGLTTWMPTARLVRGEMLTLRERDYVNAALALGAPDWKIMRMHLLPNVFPSLAVQATLSLSLAIMLESTLSYLGLGVQPPTPSWGNILSNGRNFMRDAWWFTTFPGLAIFTTIMASNFLGDGLRDALDPRLK
jgi:peptide/nickel transport system permease protein